MRVGFKKSVVLNLLAVLLLSSSAAAQIDPQVGIPEPSKESVESSSNHRLVVRVIDGDTIVVSPNEKVRLIGVATPETIHPKKAVACFGKEAKQFTHDSTDGKTVRLIMDAVNAKRRHKDRYGRTLAYAYLPDGKMLNAELIRQGYAHAYTRFSFRYLAEFKQLERQARNQSVGLWSRCSLSEP